VRLVIALAVIVAPVAVLCIVVAQDSYRTAGDLALSQTKSDAALADLYLRAYFDKYFGTLKTLAAERAQGVPSEASAPDGTQTLLERVALDHPRVYALVTLDNKGVVTSSSRPEALGLDCSQSEWWQRLVQSHTPVVSDFENSPPLGGPVVVLAVPVPGDTESMALTLNTSTMSTVWEGLLSAGVVVLTDTKGIPIMQSNQRDLTTDERMQMAKSGPILPMVQDSSGIVTFRNVPGLGTSQPVIGAGLRDPEYGWSVIAMEQYDTVLGPLKQEQITTWVMLAVSLLISFGVAVLLIGRGPVRRIMLPEISVGGKDSLNVVFDYLRQHADNGLYGEVSLRFRGGRIYRATISRERVFD